MHAQGQQNRTLISLLAVAVAIAVAGLVVFFTTTAPPAHAQEIGGTQSNTLAKGDRLPTALKGTACSPSGWPNYEQKCLFDRRRPADAVPVVRVVKLERPAQPAAATAVLALR